MLAFFIRRLTALPVFVCALCTFHAAAAAAATPQCEDFLQRVASKPVKLKFIACTRAQSTQVAVLEAKYAVEGRHAAAVERYFIRHAAMQPLRFVCCGREAMPNRKGGRWGRLHSGYEFDFVIQMTPGETSIHSRRDWARIDRFEVIVLLPLESP